MLALTQAGLAREDSYRLVQKNAMRAWNGEGNLLDLLKADPDVSKALPGPTTRSHVRPRLSPETGGHDLRRGVFGKLTALESQGSPVPLWMGTRHAPLRPRESLPRSPRRP